MRLVSFQYYFPAAFSQISTKPPRHVANHCFSAGAVPLGGIPSEIRSALVRSFDGPRAVATIVRQERDQLVG